MRTGRNVVWVGRLDEPKNPLLALESWALMAQQERPMLRFIGDGPLRSVLEDRCRELGLAHCVEFLGFQPAPQQWMLTADVLLLTSVSYTHLDVYKRQVLGSSPWRRLATYAVIDVAD